MYKKVDSLELSRNNIGEKYFGKSFCFTGEFQTELEGKRVSRSDLERYAENNGLVVKKGVTKSLDYLVAADPDSLSGKAKKARRYDIPVISEVVFFNLIN